MEEYLRLKELRESTGKSQSVTAEELGMTRPALASYETGSRKLTPENLKKLSDYYNVSIDYLLGKTDIKYKLYKEYSDIDKQVEILLSELESNDSVTFQGNAMDETTRSLLIQSLRNSIELAKSISNEK